MKRIVIDCFKLVKGSGKSIGIYNFAVNYVKAISGICKEEYNLIVIGNPYNANDFSVKNVEFIEEKILNPFNKVHCLYWELFAITGRCKKLSADIVVFPRGFAALSHSVTDIVVIHDLIPFLYDREYPGVLNWLENKYIMSRLRYSAQKCSRIITISEFSKKDIIEKLHVDVEKISVIYNACSEIKAESVKRTEEHYIASVTSGLPHKNAEGIIHSYEKYCHTEENPLPLIVIGIENVDKYGLPQEIQDKITCYKYIESNKDLYSIISGADLFLFLSLYEGFGFPPLEAMLLGVPVICSNRSSLPEVVGDAAILVDPSDIMEVVGAMIRLTKDKKKRSELIEKGYKNANRFSPEEQARLYWEVLLSTYRKENGR